MIFVYEDEGYRGLEPLVWFRPVFDLLCGRESLLVRIAGLYPGERIGLLVRPELARLTAEQHPGLSVNADAPDRRESGPALFLSGRAVFRTPIPVQGREEVFIARGEVAGFRVRARPRPALPFAREPAGSRRFPMREVDASLIGHPWDITALNESELARPLRAGRAGALPGVRILGPRRNLRLGPGAAVEPNAVLDLRGGAIGLGSDALVRPGSVVAGPCHVGVGTIIDGALVRPGCSFGPQCRIGGEVEASVFLGYVNKHHEGFIGHAVVAEWVNLGALTTNSDLRNDYGDVKVTLAGRETNSGQTKVGCFIGDHAKTAIGTLLNTGANVGIFANWFEPGLSPKVVPAFAWGRRGRWGLADALETARAVMSRRGVTMSREYEKLVRRYHAESKE